MSYQVNLRKWQLPWHEVDFDEDYGIYVHFAGFACFQFHWYSNTERMLDWFGGR